MLSMPLSRIAVLSRSSAHCSAPCIRLISGEESFGGFLLTCKQRDCTVEKLCNQFDVEKSQQSTVMSMPNFSLRSPPVVDLSSESIVPDVIADNKRDERSSVPLCKANTMRRPDHIHGPVFCEYVNNTQLVPAFNNVLKFVGWHTMYVTPIFN